MVKIKSLIRLWFFVAVLILAGSFFGACALPGDEAANHYSASERKRQMQAEDTSSWYCYNMLTAKERIWYEDIYLTLKNMETDRELYPGNITDIGLDGLERIFQCVMGDHPEIFYVDGYTYAHYSRGGKVIKITYSGNYTMDRDTRDVTEAKLKSRANYILADLKEDATDYEKVRFVYEYVIRHTTYERDSVDNQNICSVLLHGKSVCQGYAKTVQYLLLLCGVDSTLVTGTVYNGEGHALNLVKIDGEYYYVDATWGDASYQSETTGEEVSYLPAINYEYLCVDTDTIELTHKLDSPVSLPDCKAKSANYYVMEGAFFSEFDEETLKAYIQKQKDLGKKEIGMKCADLETYQTFYQELIGKQKIFSYLSGNEKKVAYSTDDRKYSLTFWLVNE